MKEKIKTILLILLVAALAIWIFNQIESRNEKENLTLCKTFKCQYNPSQKLWEFIHLSLGIEKYFPTQEQCLDYCVTQLKADSYLKKELKELYKLLP